MNLQDAVKKNQDLLSKKNVVGIGVGEKWSKGVNTHQPALLVMVSQKQNKSNLATGDLIPDKIDGLVTDVVGRVGELKAQVLTNRVRPIKAGYSCGHLHVTAGTLGGWFRDKEGDIVGLSNNHVLANENKARKSPKPGKPGHWTVQPGVYDDPNWRRNKVGNLKDFVRLKRRGNQQDSAIFRPDRLDLVDPEIYGIGIPAGFNLDPTIGMDVQKTGRTTEHTTGRIISMGATVSVGYSSGVFTFEDQIITTAMSQGGDSGSLLLDTERQIVGLLFAGSNTVTIHNPIKYPKDYWGLEIYDPTPITETARYVVMVDGAEVDAGSMPDLNKLLADARRRARNGEQVEVSFFYTAS